MSKSVSKRNYDDDKAKLKAFLTEFHLVEGNGRGASNRGGIKNFVYSRLLTKLAHREEVSLAIDLDHLQQFDPDLAEAVRDNTRR